MSFDISPEIRTAIIGDSVIAPLLSTWKNAPAVFTRRPISNDALLPLITVNPDILYDNMDALNRFRDVITRDVIVYGDVAPAGSPEDHTRKVETIGYRLRDIFHRKPQSLFNSAYHVISINAMGPRIAPTDDDTTVARVVTLTVRVQTK